MTDKANKQIKFKLKRFMTVEELETFNSIRDVEFPETKLSSAYIASLDLYYPTDLNIEDGRKSETD